MAASALVVGLSGCGDNVRGSLDETEQVTAAILALGDAAGGGPETFQTLFVAGSAPENRKDYATAIFEVVGEPDVSGDTGTATVSVTRGYGDSQAGDSVKGNSASSAAPAEVQWTLQKVENEWKLKSAPLQ
ncbi:hypothetical protein [Thalassoroseus pseudoceratinae]|uniref:hypothetical protein n=1 Tax=Thalassoroseus pseudoceratinae TaxID=2713176 RepID=UPI00141E1E7B|nr:hypothetical protein [Thalassoroseus pseudoceratinae]